MICVDKIWIILWEGISLLKLSLRKNIRTFKHGALQPNLATGNNLTRNNENTGLHYRKILFRNT